MSAGTRGGNPRKGKLPAAGAPSGDACRLLALDHASPERPHGLVKAGQPWLRPRAHSGLVLATQNSGDITERRTTLTAPGQ